MAARLSVVVSSSLIASLLVWVAPAHAEETSREIPGPCVSERSVEAVEPLRDITVRITDDRSTDPSPTPSPSASDEPPAPSPTTDPTPTDGPSPSPTTDPTPTDGPSPSPMVTQIPASQACPAPVEDLRAIPGDRSLEIDWSRPGDDVSSVWVQVSPGDLLIHRDPADTTVRIDGLRNTIEYVVTVTTANDSGAGESRTATGTPGIEGPAEIAGLVVTFAEGVVTPEGRADVPGESRVLASDLTIAEDLGAGLHRVDLAEPVPAGVAQEIARELSMDPAVVSAEPDYLLLPASADQWNLSGEFGINLPAAADPAAGEGTTVAIIDTGSTEHPRLRWAPGRDFVSDPAGLGGDRAGEQVAFDGDYIENARFGPQGWDDDPSDPGDWRTGRDSTWHGTAVAGIITATAPAASIVPVRALSWRGGLLSDIAAGITWASGASVGDLPGAADPADVIVLSLAAQATCTPVLQKAISAATERGALVVAAAGNGAADASGYLPASCADVLTVGSSTIDGARADYSNHGSVVDISAPGGTTGTPIEVLSNRGARTPDASSTSTSFGTSIAAAHVAGVAAVYRSSSPEKTPSEVASALSKQVQPFAGDACDSDSSVTCGSGIVLAQVAVTSTDDTIVANYAVGTSPQNVMLTADEAKVVVTNKGSNTVSVLTVASGTMVTYSVNGAPVNIAIDGSSLAYISHEGSAIVTRIDLTDPNASAVTTIDFGSCTQTGDVAFHSGKVFLACRDTTRVWDGTTVTSLAAPALRYNTTASYVYASMDPALYSDSSHDVYRITPSDDTVEFLSSSIGGRSSAFAIDPTSTYSFSEDNNYLRQYRISDGTLLKVGQPAEIRRTRDLVFAGTDRLYIYNDAGNLTTLSYDDTGWTTLRSTRFGPGTAYKAYGMDVAADASYAWITMTTSLSGEAETGYLRKVELSQSTAAAPTNLTATAGDGNVTLSFTPGDPGTAAVTNYEYRLYSGGSWGAWTAFSPAITASPAVITSLTNGTSYSVQLRAITGVGDGDAASVSFVAGQAAAPSSLSASVTTTTATVTFTPGANGGAPITNYEYSINNGSSWTSFSPAATTSPVTITGLSPDTSYSVKLRAVNGLATGAASSTLSIRTSALNAPSAPTSLTAVPSTTSAVVSFTVGSDGGSPLLRFEYSIDSGTTWTSAGTTTSPITVTGLAAGTAYAVLLRGVNSVGNGAASSAVTFTTSASSSGSSSPESASSTTTPVVTIPEAVLVAPIPPATPVTVPAVGSAVVTVNGRDIPVSTRKTPRGTWRVSAPDFSVDFTPIADAAYEQARFICPAGSWVQIDGDGFAPGATVSAYLFSTRLRSASTEPAVLGRGTVQSDGSVQVRADVPRGSDLGRFTLQVNGLGPDGAVRVVNMGMEVVAGTPRLVKERTAAAAFFAGGSARFSTLGRARLRSLVASLPQDRGEVRITVSAVATSREDFDANLQLATQRARKIRALLDRRGVDGAITVNLTTGVSTPEEGVYARSSRGKLLTTVMIGYETTAP